MRDIKFRAWNDGVMVYDVHLNCFGERLADTTQIIMQYTGLHDRNGKEIYEGDIVKFSNEIDEVYEEIGVVDFDLSECGYKATYKTKEYNDSMGYYVRTNCIYLIDSEEYECAYEVVGNIHENPELLKEAE